MSTPTIPSLLYPASTKPGRDLLAFARRVVPVLVILLAVALISLTILAIGAYAAGEGGGTAPYASSGGDGICGLATHGIEAMPSSQAFFRLNPCGIQAPKY